MIAVLQRSEGRRNAERTPVLVAEVCALPLRQEKSMKRTRRGSRKPSETHRDERDKTPTRNVKKLTAEASATVCPDTKHIGLEAHQRRRTYCGISESDGGNACVVSADNYTAHDKRLQAA